MPESVTAAEVVGCIRELHRARQGTLLIAVDGLGGAGKTTLARKIAAEVEALQERRERLGISYISFLFSEPTAVAPLVARLSGT